MTSHSTYSSLFCLRSWVDFASARICFRIATLGAVTMGSNPLPFQQYMAQVLGFGFYVILQLGCFVLDLNLNGHSTSR